MSTQATRSRPWSVADAERYLGGLEPIGWRLGLERMRLLTDALGKPQHRFASIHVVGTNGKSSVSAMTAALLEAHGVRTGACVSPHVNAWSERVLVRGEPVDGAEFARCVELAAEAAEAVDRGLPDGDAVTQFELATAAAFLALARARVEVGVIEAGLGGRLDATNVLPSRVTALTSIGRDHVEWLGERPVEIAGEKLAVLRERSALVLGSVEREVEELARRTAAERRARVVEPVEPEPRLAALLPGPYLRRNVAVALACAAEIVGPLDPARSREAISALELPGRLELLDDEPPLIADGAHNPDGAAALAEALPELARGRPVTACLAILSDKDAAGIARSLAGAVERVVACEIPSSELRGSGRPGARFLEAERLAELCAAAGVAEVEAVPAPEEALERARRRALADRGVALCAAPHYLLSYAWTARRALS